MTARGAYDVARANRIICRQNYEDFKRLIPEIRAQLPFLKKMVKATDAFNHILDVDLHATTEMKYIHDQRNELFRQFSEARRRECRLLLALPADERLKERVKAAREMDIADKCGDATVMTLSLIHI